MTFTFEKTSGYISTYFITENRNRPIKMVAKLSLLLVFVIFGLVESRPDWNLVLKARSDGSEQGELQSPAAGGSFKFVDSCLKAFADQVWKDGDQVHNLNTIVGHSFGCLKTSVDIIVKGAFSELPKILDENVDKEARKEALTSLIVFIEDVTEEIAYVSKIVEKLIEVSHYGSNTNAALVFAKCSFENLNREMESREDCEDKALAPKGIPTPKPTPTSSLPTTPEQQPAEKRQKILRELKNLLQVLNKTKVF
ncbi:hypothetical protein KUTeg_020955 [Tegillarca granosa]|uniref:Uncharacterized protein n=1 Tax=Tegillarca granosa TaxID=220873 RepID=A0ABQ9E9F6_TEGGR|nr:hypothetical protein KUTeg_020955 [Tegillarca granosa]